jgi:uncharacterized protein YodC (DUF2158 family)
MSKFSVGDVVQLKSGSPPMTVVQTFEPAEGIQTCDLIYFDREPGFTPDGKAVTVLRQAHTVDKLDSRAVELIPQRVTLAAAS